MSQRLIIGLEPGANWVAVKQHLVDQGADWSRDPTPEQPDVLIVSIPDGHDVEAVLRRTKDVPGVRYAERDALRWTI